MHVQKLCTARRLANILPTLQQTIDYFDKLLLLLKLRFYTIYIIYYPSTVQLRPWIVLFTQ